MKIDEASINHNATLLVKDLIVWDMCDRTDSDDNLRIMSLGYIQGVCDMAEQLKKVLKA